MKLSQIINIYSGEADGLVSSKSVDLNRDVNSIPWKTTENSRIVYVDNRKNWLHSACDFRHKACDFHLKSMRLIERKNAPSGHTVA